MSRRRRPSPVRNPPSHRASRVRLVAAGAIAAALVAALAFAVVRMNRAPAPPLPPALSQLGPLAPEIEEIVRQSRDSVVQEPSDGLRWGRYAMACEANGLVGAARDGYTTAAALQSSEAKWWFRLAAVEARLGDVDAAVGDVRRAIELKPTYAPAFWRLGLWLLDTNQLEGAERAFDRATEIDPSDRAGWIGLARVYLQKGEAERAAGLLERLLGSGPGEPYLQQLLGTAYRRLGRLDAAASALDVGVRGEAQWSDPWTDEMLGFRRGYAALLRDATAYITAGQFLPAIRILEQLRREKPDDPVLLAHLGQVYVAAGQDSAGVPLLEQAIAREPDRFEAYVDLATGYMHQENIPKARAAAERAVAINPSFAPAYETLGLILWRDGDPRAAAAAFDDAIRRDPRNARARVWLAMVYTNIGRPAYALKTFRDAVRADPTNVDAWIGIANAEMNRQDLAAAGKAVQNAQRLQPDRPAVKQTVERLQSLQSRAPLRRQPTP